MTYREKIFVKARHFKKQSALRVKIPARSPETAKFSVDVQRSEQVKAYDHRKVLIIKRKMQVLFIVKI